MMCGDVQMGVWGVQIVCGDVQMGCADGVGSADGCVGCADGCARYMQMFVLVLNSVRSSSSGTTYFVWRKRTVP